MQFLQYTMNELEAFFTHLPELEIVLAHTFKDKKLLLTACTHSSFTNEYKHEVLQNNERLEFLGDSIFNLVISELLYRLLPDTDEGKLSALRSTIVSATSCSEYASLLGLQPYLLVGKGELINKGTIRHTLLADFFEALMGALYLDAGIHAVQDCIQNKLYDAIEKKLQNPALNWKAELQEHLQKIGKGIPTYKVLSEKGPDHSKVFEVGVFIDDTLAGAGSGNSKKEAEQKAAKEALEHLS